jgi:TM2 domain-containing membrane protein YozV
MPSVCCPGCQQMIEVTDEEVASGLIVECSGCDSRFRVQASAPSSVVRRAPVSGRVDVDAPGRAADELAPKETKFCHECGAKIRQKAVVCPQCGVAQAADFDEGRAGEGSGNRVAAGICGILFGALGVHKFILGMPTAGLIMLLVSLLTCGVGAVIMHPIGFIEGIIYLTKSDADFYRTYVIGKKEWF